MGTGNLIMHKHDKSARTDYLESISPNAKTKFGYLAKGALMGSERFELRFLTNTSIYI